jgi:dolichyl-phosphate beta-glucosyltransferase
MMGRTFNFIVQAVGVRGLRDTQCGFKLLDGEVARKLFSELQIERFAYDVELVWLARRHGYQVVEVGVRWADSPASKVNPMTDSARMFWDVMALRWRYWKNGKNGRNGR